MKFKIKERYNAAIIELSGDIIGGPETTEFSNEIKKLLADNKKNIIIDLGQVKFMNSSGLGMLISALTTVKKENGNLKLANITDKIESLLMITKLITIFETYQSVDEAVESLSK